MIKRCGQGIGDTKPRVIIRYIRHGNRYFKTTAGTYVVGYELSGDQWAVKLTFNTNVKNGTIVVPK